MGVIASLLEVLEEGNFCRREKWEKRRERVSINEGRG